MKAKRASVLLVKDGMKAKRGIGYVGIPHVLPVAVKFKAEKISKPLTMSQQFA